MLMDEKRRGAEYAAKRAQALRNMERRIQKELFPKAKLIIAAARKYRRGNKLYRQDKLLEEAREITKGAAGNIKKYTEAYAFASAEFLGTEGEGIASLLSGKVYGKTIDERMMTYLDNFAEDMVRMIKAGVMMDYKEEQILSAIRTGYKDPYRTSVITKARRKDVNIATPSYGKGVFRNAYSNIVRNSTQVIALAWGLAEKDYGMEMGAVGFRVHRGSSFPCDQCDHECSYVHKWTDPFPPFHVSCVCYVEFVFEDDLIS